MMNFELILFLATVISGFLTFLDIYYFAPKRRKARIKKMPPIFDYARSIFPILFVIFFIRSFIYEPFHIPSVSLKPTLLEGDFVLINKFNYGIYLPIIHTKVIPISAPQRGDIIAFRHPQNPSLHFIKRIIGLPGDHIVYKNKILYINNTEIHQYPKDSVIDSKNSLILHNQEDLFGVKHDIYQNPSLTSQDFDVIVPNDCYFLMGDNRDDSDDSRDWGFVPEKNIIGKATQVWISYDSKNKWIRWERVGKSIH